MFAAGKFEKWIAPSTLIITWIFVWHNIKFAISGIYTHVFMDIFYGATLWSATDCIYVRSRCWRRRGVSAKWILQNRFLFFYNIGIRMVLLAVPAKFHSLHLNPERKKKNNLKSVVTHYMYMAWNCIIKFHQRWRENHIYLDTRSPFNDQRLLLQFCIYRGWWARTWAALFSGACKRRWRRRRHSTGTHCNVPIPK